VSPARRFATAWLVAGSALTRLAAAAPDDAPPPAPAPAAPAPAVAPNTPAPAAAPSAATPPAATPPAAAAPASSTAAAPVAPAPANPAASGSATLVPVAAAPPAADQSGEIAAGTDAPAEKDRSSLEIALAFGPTVVGGEAANPEFNPSLTRVGAFGELAIAYRSSYFVDPFFAVGYATLAHGESQLPNGEWGTGGTLKQSLGAWTISPGLTADIWRFRPRFAIGLAIVKQGYSFGGEEHTASQTPLVTQLGLGFVAHDGPRFRLDIEARAVLISGAEVNFGTLDLILRGDAIYFGG
jgi:hypothetical protein